MTHRVFTPLLLVALVCSTVGCGGKTKRIGADEDSEIEQGTAMTSQDFRSITQRMARSLVTLPQVQNSTTPPKLAFLRPENKTNDYMDTEAFLNKMRTELIKNGGGRLLFLDRQATAAIERENRDKEAGRLTTAGPATRFGADFFLTGAIESIDRVANKGHTTYYRYSFRLTDAATSVIVWEDDYEIKKYSTTPLVYR